MLHVGTVGSQTGGFDEQLYGRVLTAEIGIHRGEVVEHGGIRRLTPQGGFEDIACPLVMAGVNAASPRL